MQRCDDRGRLLPLDSSNRRNTRGYETSSKALRPARQGVPAERFPGSVVKLLRDGQKFVDTMRCQVGAAREVVAEKTIGVLIAAALPGSARVCEVDVEVGRSGECPVLGHLGALIPGQSSSQRGGQMTDGGDERVADGFGSPLTSEVPEHHEAGGAFDQCRDRRSTQRADDEIALPMPWNFSRVNLCRSRLLMESSGRRTAAYGRRAACVVFEQFDRGAVAFRVLV